MADLFKLVGSIFIDNDAANKSIAKTDDKASNLGKTFLNGAKNVGKFAAGVATAATGAAVALTKMASDSASSMDVIDKASQRMKVGAESYQELAHAADLSGVSMEQMEAAAKKLEGTGLNLDDALNSIMELGTAEERSAAAAELFGEKVAYNITPLLNSGSESFNAMKQEAHDLGLVFSQETVTSGAQLNDALSNVKNAISALVTGLGASLMPIITEVCGIIVNYLPTIQALFDKLAPVLVNLLSTMLPMLLDLVDQILPFAIELITELTPFLAEVCQAILPVLVDILKMILPYVIQIVRELLPVAMDLIRALLPILTTLLPILKPILDLIMVFLDPLLRIIDFIMPALTKGIQMYCDFILDKVGPAITKLVGWITGKGGIVGILQTLGDTVSRIFTNIKNTVKGAINGVLSFISGLVNGIINGVNVMIRAMNKLSFNVPDWVPVLGGKKFGFNLSELKNVNIPLLAEGAVIEPNKPFAAVLGDQKQGTNIEAPLDTIKQAVSEVVSELNVHVNVGIEPDSNGLFRIVRKEATMYTNMTGNPAF